METPRSIRQLDESVVSRIAAGEAISSPSNVIKELLENSIDAKSTRITVEIENGGYNLIRIVDDGCGINYSDLPLACKAHTTSKISQYSDLYNIHTFGFRGEALHSVSMVSYLKIMTKTQKDELGSVANYQNGEIVDTIDQIAFNRGTTIESRNLFYNYPIRLKGIKPISESKKITDIVSKYSINYPAISFTVRCDRKEMMTTYGSLSDSESVMKLLYYVNETQFFHCNFELNGDVYIDLMLGEPNTKVKKKINALFINGRLVKNDSLTKGIEEAYLTYSNFGSGSVQFSFITMKMPPQNVDVNIHPKKEKVSFLNEKMILNEICEKVKIIIKEHSQKQNETHSHSKTNSTKKSHQPNLENQLLLHDFIPDLKEPTTNNLDDSTLPYVPTKSITKALESNSIDNDRNSDNQTTNRNSLFSLFNPTNRKKETNIKSNQKHEVTKPSQPIEKLQPNNNLQICDSNKKIESDNSETKSLDTNLQSKPIKKPLNQHKSNETTSTTNQFNESIQVLQKDSFDNTNDKLQSQKTMKDISLPTDTSTENSLTKRNNQQIFLDETLDNHTHLESQLNTNQQINKTKPIKSITKTHSDQTTYNVSNEEHNEKENTTSKAFNKEPNDTKSNEMTNLSTNNLQQTPEALFSLHDLINEKDESMLISDSPNIQQNPHLNEHKLKKKKLFNDLKYEPNKHKKSSIKKTDCENTPKLEDLFSQIGDSMKRKFRVVKLNSIINLRKQRNEEVDIELNTLFHSDQFEFVGFIGTKSVVFNCPILNSSMNDNDDYLPFKVKKERTNLYIFNLFTLMKDLLRHKFLELFSNIPTFNVEIQLNDLLNSNLIENHFFNDLTNKETVKKCFEDHGMMLLEYFSIMYKNGMIKAMPDVIRGYRPSFVGFPLFMEKLITCVDWEEEMSCFDGIIDQLSSLYSIFPIDENNQKVANNLKFQFKSAVLPILKEEEYKPNISLRTGKSFVVIPNPVS